MTTVTITDHPHTPFPDERPVPSQIQIPVHRRHARLIAKILTEAGGQAVRIAAIEEDHHKLLARGRRWSTENMQLSPERHAQPHRGSAEHYRQQPHQLQLITGYGLLAQADGLLVWAQHAWLWDTKGAELIETTTPRAAYWGFALSHLEAQNFCWENQ